MNFITRFSALCLRKSKMQQRYLSSRRPAVPLGSRILTDPAKIFEHNMWDHVQWSQEEEERAKNKAAENSLVKVRLEDQDKYEREASNYWNEFYKTHKNNFFKDRNWLFLEFPEILPEEKREQLKTEEKSSELIKSTSSFPHQDFHGMFEEGKEYWKSNYGEDSTSVLGQICNKNQAKSVTDNSQDENCREQLGKLESFPGSGAAYRVLEVGCGAGNSVFPILKVLCHIRPTIQLGVLPLFMMCVMMLYPTLFLMRYWMSFSLSLCSLLFILTGHCLSENFYVRGDGTRVYFFTKDEVWNMFNLAGLTEVQNLVDRRLQVNRKKKVKMQRVWIQSKFQKPFLLSLSNPEETTKRHPYG
ncbi:tRNA N(3)-methylcytidine methyltransferase METTL8, mitochondrial isoform X3 [Rhea pennata]|uniref:tRNA N(3)-methylcytidine methyltransferase METTL8, mitochondrial isoform X3 n=1 Tax=Rhea pennata TaxID=8795 RepID=UPI002E26E835